MAQAAAFRSEHKNKPSREGLQMSLVAPGWHYIRDGVGPEQLYDLRRDSSELLNLVGSAEVNTVLEVFRRTLLDVLTDDRGSTEVENVYLARYRAIAQISGSGELSPLPGRLMSAASEDRDRTVPAGRRPALSGSNRLVGDRRRPAGRLRLVTVAIVDYDEWKSAASECSLHHGGRDGPVSRPRHDDA